MQVQHNAMHLAKLGYKLFFLLRCIPQAMVYMGSLYRDAKLLLVLPQNPEQSHGVRPARKSHDNRIAELY